MFETSTQVTMGVVLYPNISDDWKIDSPFNELLEEAEIAYVFSPSIDTISSELHLIKSILNNVSKISNSIDFISKIDVEKSEEQISNGIGGISRLKDFSFTLLLSISTLDLIKFYGRKIEVVLWEGNEILNVTSGQIVFKGEVYKINRDKEEIIFSVRELLSSLKTEVKGASVVDIEGEITYEPILLGYNENMSLLPLKKIKDQYGATVLSFSESDKYIIKDIYIKQSGVNDKPIYNKVLSDATIKDKIVFFGEKDRIFAYTAENITLDQFQIDIHDYYIMGFSSVVPYVFAPDDYIERLSPPPIINTSCKWLYLRSEVISDKTYYLFATVWDAFYGETRLNMETYFEENNNIPFCVNHNLLDNFVADSFIDYSEAKIKKEIDAVRFSTGLEYDANVEPSEIANEWNQYKVMTSIPEGVVIKIDDEEMLVINTQKVYPLLNENGDNPKVQRITVERGWNKTVPITHLDNAIIKLKTDTNSSIMYEYNTELKNITTINSYGEGAQTNWRTQNINSFLDGTGDLIVSSWGKVYQHYLGLFFDMPDLKGDLKIARLVGSAKSTINQFPSSLVNEIPQYISAYISLSGLEGWFDETNKSDKWKSSRVYFGRNEVQNTTTYQIGNSSLTAVVNSGIITKQEGNYSIILSGAWKIGVFKDCIGIIPPFKYNGKNIYYDFANGYDQTYGLLSLNDLKEGIYISFRGSNYYKLRSTFALSRPKLKLEISALVNELDFYADVIPKTVLDAENILDEIATGDNPKFFVTKDLVNFPYGIVLTISSDDTKIIQSAYVNLTDGSLYNIKELVGTAVGTLMYSPFDNKFNGTSNFMYKVYKSEFKYLSWNTLTGVETIVSSSYPPTYLERAEYTYYKYENFIFVASGKKVYILNTAINLVNNPVQVIKNLLIEYAPKLTLDETSFTQATLARKLWHMYKIIIKPFGLIKLIDEIAKQHCLLLVEKLNGDIAIVPLSVPGSYAAELTNSEFVYNNGEIAYRESFSELDYLITKMDVKYDVDANDEENFKGLIKSDDLALQNLFDLAKEFTDNEILVNLELDTVYEKATARLSAGVKMHYHFMPNRSIDFNSVKPSEICRDLGEWVKCTCTKIGYVTGNLYLILGVGITLPFREENFIVELNTYEWLGSANVDLAIQEVPESSLADYQETHTADIDIQEVSSV